MYGIGFDYFVEYFLNPQNSQYEGREGVAESSASEQIPCPDRVASGGVSRVFMQCYCQVEGSTRGRGTPRKKVSRTII